MDSKYGSSNTNQNKQTNKKMELGQSIEEPAKGQDQKFQVEKDHGKRDGSRKG
jgi:hypothetical protein